MKMADAGAQLLPAVLDERDARVVVGGHDNALWRKMLFGGTKCWVSDVSLVPLCTAD